MKNFMINFLWSWHKKRIWGVFFFLKKMLGREGKHFASLIKLWNNLFHKNVILGGRFKREGTDVYRWLIHVDIWQKPAQHCKAIILQMKNNKILKGMFCKGRIFVFKRQLKTDAKIETKSLSHVILEVPKHFQKLKSFEICPVYEFWMQRFF